MELPFHVFLSHNSQDKDLVREIYEILRGRGLRPWLDEEDLTPGRTWNEELEAIIESVPAAAVLVGGDGIGPWENIEMRACLMQFVDRRLPVIPVLLPGAAKKPDLPLFLQAFTWVDLRAGLDSKGIDRLVHGITGKKPAPAAPAIPPVATPTTATGAAHKLSEALEAAYRRKEDLTVAGADTQTVNQEILELRRQMREGGRLQEGDILAERYRLIKLLGRGGFASVWEAYDRREQYVVAVKVLHGQFATDQTRLDRFFRGARKMAELQHEGIVKVLERRLDDGGYHFFVMEYVAGGDLRQAVLEKRLASDRVIPLLTEVAAALEHAHQRGLVHRDIKPANILLDKDGRPKLTDFDLVRGLDTTGGTLDGSMLGTFLYAAPEAMSNSEKAGVPADVYSLAMTAAFCFFGTDLPADALRNTEGFFGQLVCPAGVRAVLRKAADWRTEERFASVAKFAQSLAEVAASEEPEADDAESPIERKDLESVRIAAWNHDFFARLVHALRSYAFLSTLALWGLAPIALFCLFTLLQDFFSSHSSLVIGAGVLWALAAIAVFSIQPCTTCDLRKPGASPAVSGSSSFGSASRRAASTIRSSDCLACPRSSRSAARVNNYLPSLSRPEPSGLWR